MDYQQTASNQSSVRTGTENIHSDKDQTIHEGSTWIQGPNGQQYELNGTFKQTAAGWEASGTFIDQNGKSWSGTMTGTAKNMEAFQNNVKNGDEAVLQALSIDTSNLSRSHERHQDNINTANNVDQANNIFERKTVEDYSKLKDTSDVTKNNIINENNNIDQNNTIKENKHVEDNTTSISTGTHYKGVAQAAMGKTEDFEKMMSRLADMKQAVLNGDMSAKEFQAEVRNFSGAYAQEMGNFLSKQEKENWSVDRTAKGNINLTAQVDSGENLAGAIVEKTTGASMKGSLSVDAGISNTNQDATTSAQNLIAKEMYDTIMQSGNVNDMVNNASNLANTHSNTNLSDLENLADSMKNMAGDVKQTFNNAKDGVKKLF